MSLISSLPNLLQKFVRRRFVRDTVVLQSGQFVNILVGGVTSVLITRILGPQLLGIYTLAFSMSNVMGLLDLSAAGRVALMEIARALGADDHQEILDALAYAFRISFQINGVLVLGFFFAAPYLAQLSYHNAEIGVWARWLGLLELTDILYGTLSLCYQTQRDMNRLVRLETTRLIITGVLTAVVLLLHFGVAGLVFGQLAISLGFAAYSIWGYHQLAANDPRFPTWGQVLQRMSSVGIRSRLFLGIGIAIDKNVGAFLMQLPILMLGAVDQTAVGYFGTALKVITLPQPLLTGITRNLDVLIPFRSGQGQSSLHDAFVRSTLYTGLIWSLATLGLAIIAVPMLIVVYGMAFVPAVPMLFPLLLQSVAMGLGVSLGSTFRTLNKLVYSIIIAIISAGIFYPLGNWLIQTQGGYGAAWFYGGRLLLQTLLAIAVVLWLMRRKQNAQPSST